MGIIDVLYDYCDVKMLGIKSSDPHGHAKAFGWGMVRGIPDGLATIGAMVLVVATMNFVRGKGFGV